MICNQIMPICISVRQTSKFYAFVQVSYICCHLLSFWTTIVYFERSGHKKCSLFSNHCTQMYLQNCITSNIPSRRNYLVTSKICILFIFYGTKICLQSILANDNHYVIKLCLLTEKNHSKGKIKYKFSSIYWNCYNGIGTESNFDFAENIRWFYRYFIFYRIILKKTLF